MKGVSADHSFWSIFIKYGYLLSLICVLVLAALIANHTLWRFVKSTKAKTIALQLLQVVKLAILSLSIYIFIWHLFFYPSFSERSLLAMSALLLFTWIFVGIEGRMFVACALLMLISSPLLGISGNNAHSVLTSVWVYLFLILGMITIFLEQISSRYRSYVESTPDSIRYSTYIFLRLTKQSVLHLKTKWLYIKTLLAQYIKYYFPRPLIQIEKTMSLYLTKWLYIKTLLAQYIKCHFPSLLIQIEKTMSLYSKVTTSKEDKIIKMISGITIIIWQNRPSNKKLLKLIVSVGVTIVIATMILSHWNKKIQYENQLRREFIITSVSPKQVTHAYRVTLSGYNFGFKTDDSYRLMSDQGRMYEIKKWVKDEIVFIAPIYLSEGKHTVWIERPYDELHREQGMAQSNKVTFHVYSRFLVYPENNMYGEKVEKRIKKFIFYNLPFLNEYIFKLHE